MPTSMNMEFDSDKITRIMNSSLSVLNNMKGEKLCCR